MPDFDFGVNGPFAATVLDTLLTHYNIGLLWADADLQLHYTSDNVFSLLSPVPEGPVLSLMDICQELIGYEDLLTDVALQRGAPFQIEFINRGVSDSNVRYINLTAYPAAAPDGSPGILLLVEDSTNLGIIAQDLRQKRNQILLLRKGYR